MNSKKIFLITLFLSASPLWLGLALYQRLPEVLPSHWNFAGQVDGTMGKLGFMFGTGLFLMGMQLLLCFAVKTDPKHKRVNPFVVEMTWWVLPCLSLLISTMTYAVALEKNLPINKIIFLFMSLLFLVVGNFLPKVRQNHTIGIRVPWTLDDESNWEATHRFAGHLMVWCSLLSVFTTLMGLEILSMALLFVMGGAPIIYSYRYYKKHKKGD